METNIDDKPLESIFPFRSSDQPALMMPEDDLSFGALEQAAQRLARILVEEGNDDVLILMSFGANYYVSLLACMLAGRPAVPIDPTLTIDIQRHQIQRIGPSLMLKDRSMLDDSPSHPRQWEMPPLHELVSREASDDLGHPPLPEIPGHLPLHRLFTSGSSGHPTMVTISREAMCHDISTTPALYGLTINHTLTNIGRYTSSMHINAFWRCMNVGATFMPVDLKTSTATVIINRWQRAHRLMLQGHPSLIDVIFDVQSNPIPVASIHHLILGGEPLKGGWLNKLKSWLPAVQYVSFNYSSTETMLIACRTFSMDEVDEQARIPAGLTAPGKIVRIFDEAGAELPAGVVGEIFVSSSFIGSSMEGMGAENRLKQDSETGIRTWQTRDLGRWLPDGSLEHFGRADRQVKINGQRIDPVFVEQYIESIENIKRSIVFAVRDGHGRQQLAAIYEAFENVLPINIRGALSERLPAGFIPTVIIRVDQIPATHRGKPDFEAMERIVHEHWDANKADQKGGSIHDDTGVGLFLQQKWAALLPGGGCVAGRSIFDQGADSIMLLKIISAITDRFKISLNVGFLLQHVTLDAQTAALLEMMKKTTLKDASGHSDQINIHFF